MAHQRGQYLELFGTLKTGRVKFLQQHSRGPLKKFKLQSTNLLKLLPTSRGRQKRYGSNPSAAANLEAFRRTLV